MSEVPVLKDSELLYAATARCRCGAGLAYPADHKLAWKLKSWFCSAFLRGDVRLKRPATEEEKSNGAKEGYISSWCGGAVDATEQVHDEYPFVFYEIKSEIQPSAGGATTRPSGNAADAPSLKPSRADSIRSSNASIASGDRLLARKTPGRYWLLCPRCLGPNYEMLGDSPNVPGNANACGACVDLPDEDARVIREERESRTKGQ